jgi:uncharacterized protein YyaL (SSP411 family)
MLELIRKNFDYYLSPQRIRARLEDSRDRQAFALRPAADDATHLAAAVEWLCRAHDACGKGGVARAYKLVGGWDAPYPETTGYIIPTLFDYAALTGDRSFADRAMAMADWEADVQLECGGVRAGTMANPVVAPTIFNTGQVLFGWARAFAERGDERHRTAAERAADWLVAAMDDDGAWRRHGSVSGVSGSVNVYNTRSAWGLAEVHRVTGDDRYLDAAVKNVSWALSQQLPNGWFENNSLMDIDNALLHTIAYAMRGVFEVGVCAGESRFVEAAVRVGDAVLERLRNDGSVSGTFDRNWGRETEWICLTGVAQMALNWLRLYQVLGEERFAAGARRALDYLKKTQDLEHRNPGIRGGIKGSMPLSGPYSSYELPNWAAKFFADALLLMMQADRQR